MDEEVAPPSPLYLALGWLITGTFYFPSSLIYFCCNFTNGWCQPKEDGAIREELTLQARWWFDLPRDVASRGQESGPVLAPRLPCPLALPCPRPENSQPLALVLAKQNLVPFVMKGKSRDFQTLGFWQKGSGVGAERVESRTSV